MVDNNLLATVEKLTLKQQDILTFIDSKLHEIQKHNRKYSVVRSLCVGVTTIASVAGMAGAVFTGATNLLLAGLVCGVAGVGASAGINSLDVFQRKYFIREIEEMVSVQQILADSVVEAMGDYFRDKEGNIARINASPFVNTNQVSQVNLWTGGSTVTGITEATWQKVKEFERMVQHHQSDAELRGMFLEVIQAIRFIINIGLNVSRWGTEVPSPDGISETREHLQQSIWVLEVFVERFRSYQR